MQPMRFAILVLSASLLHALSLPAAAQERRIGLVLPDEQTMQVLAGQMRGGADLASLKVDAELVEVTEACTAESGEEAARRLLAEDVRIVVGFLCTEAAEGALPALSEAGVPVISPALRTDSLTDRRERTGWLFYRLGPRAGAEQAAVAEIVPRIWRGALFAIIDDGTIYGRELSETVRAAAESAGLEPVFFDTFRPQLENQIGLVGRLRNAGATHVFVGGDRADIAIMARDAEGLGYELTIAGGEALRAAQGDVPLAPGVLMIGLPEWADLAGEAVLDDFAEAGVIPEGYVLPTYAAVELTGSALTLQEESGRTLPEILAGSEFPTAIGQVGFTANGDLERELYRLFRFDGDEFVPVE